MPKKKNPQNPSSSSSSKPQPKRPPRQPSSPPTTTTTSSPPPLAPPSNGQQLLDVFERAFRPIVASGDFGALVQEAKAALFERDFARAFSRPELLGAYAARWSPTRAACYAGVLARVVGRYLGGGGGGQRDENRDGEGGGGEKEGQRILQVLALGGATAELAALSAFLAEAASKEEETAWDGASIALVDLAPWQTALSPLYAALTTAPAPTPYTPVPPPALSLPSALAYTFTQADVLSLPSSRVLAAQVSSASLITLFFTLNELYSSGGVGRTTAFLVALGRAAREGAVLVVVDSPGSYAETDVGREGAKRRYPIRWLLDHTLVGAGGEAGGRTWEKVDEVDGWWFRWGVGGGGGWRYPVGLEDMRFQMHVYRARGRGENQEEGGEQEGEKE